MKRLIVTTTFSCFAFVLLAQLNMSLLSQIDYDQDVNDVWGYRSNGPDSTEYALVGTRNGLSIVSLADPENPEEVVFIDGPSSLWRDIKSWEDHVYVTNETSGGLLVVDMSQALDTITWYRWTPEVPVYGTLTDAHNLFVDEFGYGYLAGTNLPNSRTLIVDFFTDPANPAVVAVGPPVYAHDIYARDNKMYASEIYEGRMAIYDISDKQNISLLATQPTPSSFTHNIWLSDDGNVAFTTDERPNAPVAAYDISDLNNIVELDQYRPVATLGQGVVPHNVHVWNDWLILSYYDDGGIIVDASRPHNLIEVGNFDTFFGVGFGGAWGAYPFLPSGLVLVTDIANGLFVLDANYVRACFLEGKVIDAITGLPINNVTVEIDSEQPNFATTFIDGKYETGQAIPGTFDVTFSAAGYATKVVSAELLNGEVTILNVELLPNDQEVFFAADTNAGCAPLTVSFSDESLTEAASWTWSFPGGEPAISNEQHPEVVYSEVGVYSVSLEIEDSLGNTFEITREELIEVAASPVSDFSFEVFDDSVAFANNSVNATSYFWDFGDGISSTETTPMHTYSVSGTYEVTLTATNDCSSLSYTQEVVVVIPIDVAFGVTQMVGCAPLTVTFTDETIADVATWNWTFPGGDPTSSTEQNPMVTYGQPGTYTVNLEVIDGQGNPFGLTQTDFIEVIPYPTAGFALDIVADSVFFTNTSTEAISYHWDFGDGTTSTEESPVHAYDSSGQYQVILTATNECTSVSFVQNVSVVITNTVEVTDNQLIVSAYPNPFRQEVIIETSFEPATKAVITVMNAQGQRVSTQIMTSNRMTLVADWPTGVYFLTVNEQNGARLSQPLKVVKLN